MVWASHIYHNSRKYPTYVPTAQSDGNNSQLGLSLPRRPSRVSSWQKVNEHKCHGKQHKESCMLLSEPSGSDCEGWQQDPEQIHCGPLLKQPGKFWLLYSQQQQPLQMRSHYSAERGWQDPDWLPDWRVQWHSNLEMCSLCGFFLEQSVITLFFLSTWY